MRELRCRGCRRRVGLTTRTQPVPVQCTDPWCAFEGLPSQHEERDSFLEHLYVVDGRTPEAIGQLVGMTRQGVARILAS
jgi:hypothetical protein